MIIIKTKKNVQAGQKMIKISSSALDIRELNSDKLKPIHILFAVTIFLNSKIFIIYSSVNVRDPAVS